jgi:3-deoxy-manno-octulosonate cytidylyltransferase (CMP-KDO synthetase)
MPELNEPFVVAIPARHDASRLPGKPLRLLGGRPLVLHVAERALAAGASEVWVATDDERVARVLDGQGVRIAMTAASHASGSDRLAECAGIAGWADDTLVVNLQGDEPFAPPEGIRAVAAALSASGLPMATLATPITDAGQVFDPNTVKLVTDARGQALYFSRAPMPWNRDGFARSREALPESAAPFLRHIGIYAYRAGFLRQFAALPPGRLERTESLEQLRALEAGFRIAVALTPAEFPPGVDTPEDLERAQRHLERLA